MENQLSPFRSIHDAIYIYMYIYTHIFIFIYIYIKSEVIGSSCKCVAWAHTREHNTKASCELSMYSHAT